MDDVTDEAKKIRSYLRNHPEEAAKVLGAMADEGIVRSILRAALGAVAEKIPTDLGLAIMSHAKDPVMSGMASGMLGRRMSEMGAEYGRTIAQRKKASGG